MWQGEWLGTFPVCSPTIGINSLPSLLAVFLVCMINYMGTLVVRCIFPLLRPGSPFVTWDTWPLWGRLVANVNKGCTVTAQLRNRVEASCLHPVGVQSLLMGWNKALRKRGNFRNSKTVNSWSHMEGCLVLGNTALDSMQMASQGALHWGPRDLLGVMRATDWPVGMGDQSSLPNQAWSGQRGYSPFTQGLKEASQSSWVKCPRTCCGPCSI